MQAPTYHPGMSMEGPQPYASPEGLRAGLVSALLLAIPLWAAIGLALVALVAQRPLETAERIALSVAAVAELALLYYAWRALGWRLGLREALAGTSAARPVRGSLVRQSSFLLGVVGAYLHYYFWDVYLQIESLNSVTVFVPVARFG